MHLISVTEYIPISIHALLAESDRAQAAHYRNGQISIHALLAESDTSPCVVMNVRRDFYPRSPCGERRPCRPRRKRPQGISIHALLAESDENSASPIRPRNYFYPRSPCGERLFSIFDVLLVCIFLSTLSLRRATPPVRDVIQWEGIFLSTLSLRRATLWVLMGGLSCNDFYPRSPCGERLLLSGSLCCLIIFLSTLSLRRATSLTTYLETSSMISIHALLAESDNCQQRNHHECIDFYPRSPCGERLLLMYPKECH